MAFQPTNIRFLGGLDLVTPPFDRHYAAGKPIFMVNYVVTDEGYELVSGYEKFRDQEVPGTGPIYAIAQHEALTETSKTGVYVFRRKNDGKLGLYRAGIRSRSAMGQPNDWVEIPPDTADTTLDNGLDAPPAGERVRWISRSFRANEAPRLYFVTGAGPYGLYYVAEESGREEIRGAMIGTENAAGALDSQRYPRFLQEHQSHLFVGYREGSVQWSSLGRPTTFSAVTGTGEVGIANIGGQITGMVRGFQRRLWIFAADAIHFVEGTSASNFSVRQLTEEMGAGIDTAQLAETPMFFSNDGVRLIGTGGESGFAAGSVSRLIRPLIQQLLRNGVRPTTSVLLRERDQYRVYLDDKSAIVASLVTRGRREPTWEFSTLLYPKSITVASNVATPSTPQGSYLADRNLIAFGMESDEIDPLVRTSIAGDEPDGIVYLDGPPPQAATEIPDTFDGTPIHGTIHFGLNPLRHPSVIKRFNRMTFQSSARREFQVGVVFGVGSDPVGGDNAAVRSRARIAAVPQRGAGWADRYEQPQSLWNQMIWNVNRWNTVRLTGVARSSSARTPGRGAAFDLVIFTQYGASVVAPPPHTITGMSVYWRAERQTR